MHYIPLSCSMMRVHFKGFIVVAGAIKGLLGLTRDPLPGLGGRGGGCSPSDPYWIPNFLSPWSWVEAAVRIKL